MKDSIKTCDLEIKKVELFLLNGFTLLCDKNNTNVRDELLGFMSKTLNEALHTGIISKEEIINYKPIIEEY